MGETRRRMLYGSEADYKAEWGGVDPRPRDSGGHFAVGASPRCPKEKYRLPIGTVYGDLTVIGYEQYVTKNGRAWGWSPVCRCARCGSEHAYMASNLRAGRSTACNPCAKRKASDKRWWVYKAAMVDDLHRSRLLNRLSSAINRCHNPKNRVYKHYGERGITVWPQWREDYTSFLVYVQTLPGWDDPARQMDRTDNNKGYEPGNIRFATRSENTRNKRQIADLEARIRHLEQRLAQQVYDPDK